MNAIYDKIGENYDATRQADGEILQEFRSLLGLVANGIYLDVACGTGNYTSAMARFGGKWCGFDQSEKMLAEARTKSGLVNWACFDVENTDYKNGSFDGAICSLAIHHFPDLNRAFGEISRVLKNTAPLVIFTSTRAQMERYWLNEYFPCMMKASCKQMPALEAIETAVEASGLTIGYSKPFFVTPALKDLFLYSGKQRPEMYLSQKVRNNISSFRSFCPEEELNSGLKQLAEDIESGEINNVVKKYSSNLGDYLFVVACKIE